MELPKTVSNVISVLEENGFEAYAVGGCVRDWVYADLFTEKKYIPSDFDLAASASPEDMHNALSDFKLIDTGIKHGTVTVILPDCKMEITTFRIDGEYSDNRRPDSVRFSGDLKEDLARRDFTVNAMAFSEKKGLIDYFGGREDLKNKVLKCVGEPQKRFNEDALRIMRALRFMAEHDFYCETETEKALFSEKELLNRISPERLQAELCRIILGKFAERVLLEYKDIINVVIPEIKPCFGFPQRNKHHIYDVYTHTVKSLAAAVPKKTLRLTMLLHDIGKPSCFSMKGETGHFYGHSKISAVTAEKIFSRLKFDNETKRNVLILIKYHDCTLSTDRVKIKKQLRDFGENVFFKLLDVHRADDSAKADFVKSRLKTYDLIEEIAREIIKNDECYSLKQLKVTGYDITEKGYKGENVGAALQKLLTAVINEKVKNEKSDLLNFLDKNKI